MTLEEMVLEHLTDKPTENQDIADMIYLTHGIIVSTRTIRTAFKALNEKFINGEIDYMVVSNKQGSYICRDEETIRKFNEHRRKQALSLLHGAYQSDKRLNLNKNLSFKEYINGISGSN